MKWLVGFIGIICIAVAIVFFVKNQNKENANVLPAATINITSVPTPTIALKQSVVIDVEKIPTRISWTVVNPEKVELYSNLKAEQLSEQIYVDKSCQILVNGGFYSKENTHLGLFITNFEIISKSIESATHNGFLWINDNNISIGSNPPDTKARIAIQSGPLLFKDGKPLLLKINNDEPSRRIVAAKTQDNKLLFLAFYRDSAEYEGPMLGQLPEAINSFKKQTNIDIVDAINLDGGIHSIFITNYVRLNEMEHVGSYFCVK